MRLRMISVLSIAVLAGIAFAAPSPSVSDGLVPVQVRSLDEFYMRPKVDLASYRKIIIDAPQVALNPGWLKSVNGTRDMTRRIYPEDAQRITDEAAQSMAVVVADAFRAEGYEIVSAPGAGVLRLTPSVVDLWVNAPDVKSAGPVRLFTKESAGDATLLLDVRDASTGALLGRVVDRSTAREVGRFNANDRVINLLWFDAMFRQWALNCARELEVADRR